MKPQDHSSQRADPAEFSKYRRSSRYTLRKPVAYVFVMFFQENWMIKACTGSQEVQYFWLAGAVFQHKKP